MKTEEKTESSRKKKALTDVVVGIGVGLCVGLELELGLIYLIQGQVSYEKRLK